MTAPLQEFGTVVLLRDLPDVPAGTTGAVVMIHDQDYVEVEFMDPAGRTLAVSTVAANDLRAQREGLGPTAHPVR